MIRVFDRDGKVNFVDTNNRLVGYDNHQDCCEDFGWFFTGMKPDGRVPWDEFKQAGSQEHSEFLDFNFVDTPSIPVPNADVDDGGTAAFKLVSIHGDEAWLVLYNAHNGYYSHGFTVEKDGVELESGCL